MSRHERHSHAEKAERYQPDPSDAIYEEALRRCKAQGHVIELVPIGRRCGDTFAIHEADPLEDIGGVYE